jgi:tetratricopeptide (TPR) repeat protein
LTILAVALAMAGRSEEAIATARRSVEADPDAYIAHWALGQACSWGGRAAEAVEIHHKSGSPSNITFSRGPSASALGRAGRTGDAAAVYQELATRSTAEYVSPAQLAMAAIAGDLRDEAIRWAAKAWEIRDPFFYFARFYPDYEGLRALPEFQPILREMDNVLATST